MFPRACSRSICSTALQVKQDGPKWGTKLISFPKHSQSLYFLTWNNTRRKSLAVPALPKPGGVCRTALRGTFLYRGAGSWARTDPLTSPACPRVSDKRVLEAQAKSLNSVFNKIQQHTLNWRRRGFCESL